jgi:hypothetical protein
MGQLRVIDFERREIESAGEVRWVTLRPIEDAGVVVEGEGRPPRTKNGSGLGQIVTGDAVKIYGLQPDRFNALVTGGEGVDPEEILRQIPKDDLAAGWMLNPEGERVGFVMPHTIRATPAEI